jgi:hypothetical protein
MLPPRLGLGFHLTETQFLCWDHVTERIGNAYLLQQLSHTLWSPSLLATVAQYIQRDF